MSINLRSLKELTLYQFRGLYRQKIAFFFNLIFPLVLLSIFGAMFGNESSAGMSAFDHLMPGQLVVMLLSAGLITVGITVAAQRETGALRHLFSTPLSIGVWTASRVAANLVMAAIQWGVLFLYGGLVFGVSPPRNIPGTLVVLIVSMMVSLGMGLVVGVFVKGENTAISVAMPFFMVLLFFGNAAMPLTTRPLWSPPSSRIYPATT